MAAGLAKAEYLLFLHADSRLTGPLQLKDALYLMKQQRGLCAGHFPIEFIKNNSHNKIAFRFTEGKSYLNRVNTTNGDQGLFIKKESFEKLKGFSDRFSILEDQELVERIRANGKIITLEGVLKTSARRFETEGHFRLLILMSMIMGIYHAGMYEFFDQAKNLYRNQSKTSKLFLTPFFKLSRNILIHQYGFVNSLKLMYRVGSFIRSNSWQLFYFFDVLFSFSTKPRYCFFLKIHDLIFAPLTSNVVGNILSGILGGLFFIIFFPLYFYLVEINQIEDNCPTNSLGK